MAEIVRMPKLSDTMTEGVVAMWHKSVGDKVESGDLLAEIETDKATMEFESFQEGVLLHIGVEKGKAAPVDAILAILGEKGEKIDDLLAAETSNEKAPQEEKQKEEIIEDTIQNEEVQTNKENTTKNITPAITTNTGRIIASPLAKKLASEKGIDISSITGTGDGGRVIKRDVENFNGVASSRNTLSEEKYTEIEVSQMRKTIAKRLAESKFTSPHFYLTISINMDNLIDARKSINAVNSSKISFNDFIIKAAAAALKKHPKVNSSWLGDKIRINEHVNIGVAVAIEDGLLVPVVRFADGKTLTQINSEVKDYAQKARNKKLQPKDWEGSTFTISNLGMFNIEEFTAIINPPDACILAVGGINEIPVVKNGKIVPGNVMKVTLSCDHRVVDGATGATFLQTFKQLMENPVLLLGTLEI